VRVAYVTPPAQPRPRRRLFGRLGCFGSLLVIALGAVLVWVLLAPWSLHIGGQFTPLGRWSGVGRAHTPDDGDFGIQLNLAVSGRHSCSRLTGKCTDFEGNAVICTKAGRYTFTRLDGSVGGYLSLDGQPMTLLITHGSATHYLKLQLNGTWHGPAYDASDGGYLTYSFNPDGTPRAAVSSPDPAKAAQVSIRPGDFTALCHSIGTPG
jgi:hypothetical protein